MTFGEKIREARKAFGYTQRQLAEKIGAKHNSISDWENDKNKPDPDTIELLCGILELEPNYLLRKNDNDILQRQKESQSKFAEQWEIQSFERKLLDNFSKLTDDNKNKVISYTKNLYKIQVLDMEQETVLRAAHHRTDIEVTDAMNMHDNDIMNDDF